LTRHELKEQLQHDQFTDAVSGAVGYASSHRQTVTRIAIAVALALVAFVGIRWYLSSQADARRADLGSAMSILDAPVTPTAEPGVKSYPTEDAKKDAWIKAISDVVTKYPGSNEGLIAQYYRGANRAAKNDTAGAENDLRAVATAGSPVSPLAKIALANLYIGEKKTADAQKLVEELVKNPSPLVSEAQAKILQAEINQTVNPQAAKDALKSITAADQQRAAVKQAAEQLNSQLTK
jgi:hypothetical protein